MALYPPLPPKTPIAFLQPPPLVPSEPMANLNFIPGVTVMLPFARAPPAPPPGWPESVPPSPPPAPLISTSIAFTPAGTTHVCMSLLKLNANCFKDLVSA